MKQDVDNLPADSAGSLPAVAQLRFEHRADALGIGTAQPRLSWLIHTSAAGWRQAGYEIAAYAADGQPLGQTGRVDSDESALVAWPFAPLRSRERVGVRVRVWGADGGASGWSDMAEAEAGLLEPGGWSAQFVAPAWDERPGALLPAQLFRRDFEIRADVAQARLYVTALGVYEIEINGATVGDHVLAPGWTSYSHRLRYQTFDVSALLRAGRNAIGATLADGWFRGRLGFGSGRSNIYGDRLALLAQLEIRYADGTSERIVSDESWRAATGPIRSSSIYDGETYDARLGRPGWSQPGYDDHSWAKVVLVDWDMRTLVAPVGPPVRRIEERAPVAITISPSGRTLLDFGQNLVGRLRITVQGQAGQTVTLRHAEVLEHGELGTRPLRYADATDRYTLRGGTPETWEPRFTFHGFRYAEVQGWPGELRADDIRAVVCHSDLERTGWFECSDALINRLHENVVWSMRGNFLDVPTDCPQRDERLGWTGDIQVFAPTACYLFNTAGFLQSWLADLAAEQAAACGVVPFVVPNVLPGSPVPAAAWGDAAAIVPWVLYQRYGDAGILAQQYASMRAWVDLLDGIAGARHLWERGFQFGDWLDPTAPPDRPDDARTSPQLVATAYFARSADLVALAAGVLGCAEDAQRYGALAAQVREAFAREFISPAGRILSDAATAYALALEFALLPDAAQRDRAAGRLLELVRASDYHISTGFVGTPLICDALCQAGDERAAFRLLLQRENPSWLYPVTMDATTIWERWDSMLPSGAINPGEMTSFNHYALGAVADWMHRTIGGLAPGAPGYRAIAVRPRPGGGITHATARHQTPYGMAECAWAITDGMFQLTVVVPPNSSAHVTFPGDGPAPAELGAGTHRWSYAYPDPAARPPLTLDSPIGELIDDARAWAVVQDAIDRLASNVPFIKQIVHSEGATPLRKVLAVLPNAAEVGAAIERGLSAAGG